MGFIVIHHLIFRLVNFVIKSSKDMLCMKASGVGFDFNEPGSKSLGYLPQCDPFTIKEQYTEATVGLKKLLS